MNTKPFSANWITPVNDFGDVCPEYVKTFTAKAKVKSAFVRLTAQGTYEAFLNGKRLGDEVLSPGFTDYYFRHQYFEYDVSDILASENIFTVTVGKGWYNMGWAEPKPPQGTGIICEIEITYLDGSKDIILSDETFSVRESNIRYSTIYNGEYTDARVENMPLCAVRILEHSKDVLIPCEGEPITEQDRLPAKEIIITPKGETVIDFGQEITGYVEFTVNAKAGDEVLISHGEVLNKDGNFYNENYRSAKAELKYICKDGVQTHKPHLTFYGFRYIRLDKFPSKPELSDFTAILVSSKLKKTGSVKTGDSLLNRLISNVFWGQRDNFLDTPTDCPQRDERQGWLGDAQVFIKTAAYNYDVKKFFTKWLNDMMADQYKSGGMPFVVPDYFDKDADDCWTKGFKSSGAAWADAAVICPWQLYLSYGDTELLKKHLGMVEKYIAFIEKTTTTENLWTGANLFGDWLGLDMNSETYNEQFIGAKDYTGGSRADFILSAFYVYDLSLMVKIQTALGGNAALWQEKLNRARSAFIKAFSTPQTQTEAALMLCFDLTDDKKSVADYLANNIISCGKMLKTGFVGTPYLLYALSQNGYTELAYDLLLRHEYPSWLYSVDMGATTIWEHWDGIKPDGSFWSSDMNSFNHYAYGSVLGWIYEEAAGIHPLETAPGFEKVVISPKPDKRLGYLKTEFESKNGTIVSNWCYDGENVRYLITTPVNAVIIIGENTYNVTPGTYEY